MTESRGLFGLFSRQKAIEPAAPNPVQAAAVGSVGAVAADTPAPVSLGKHIACFHVNGQVREAIIEPHVLLIDVLREKLGLTGTKRACAAGNCGACTVLIDGEPVCSCLTLAVLTHGRAITTVEGLRRQDGTLHPLQQAFITHCAAQCGYCTSGMLMTASALLAANPRPTRDDVRHGLSGNICRCTGYVKIIDAVVDAAQHIDNAQEVRS